MMPSGVRLGMPVTSLLESFSVPEGSPVSSITVLCAGCWGGDHQRCEQPCQCGDLDHQDHASVSGGPTTKGRP